MSGASPFVPGQGYPWFRFQLPPRRTKHADLPHDALLQASHQGVWDPSGLGRFRR